MLNRAGRPIANANVAIFRLGDGVLVKAKFIAINMAGGIAGEAIAMKLIRVRLFFLSISPSGVLLILLYSVPLTPLPTALKQELEPHVPVPEPLHHWKDADWFTYFTVMREAPGIQLDRVYWALTLEHCDCLIKETALHLQSVGQITYLFAICPDGMLSYAG